MTTLFMLLAFATLVEGLVEYFLAPFAGLKPYLMYVAAGVGVVVCYAFGLDVFSMLQVPEPMPLAGTVLTGLIISRGANYLNDVISAFQAVPGAKA